MKLKLLLLSIIAISSAAYADLIVSVNTPQTIGQKTVVKLALKNTFPEKIESARAVVFLLDERGKMVGQSTKWVIGGTKASPALESGKDTTFNFVLQSHNANFTNLTAKVSFSQVTLGSGKQADVNKMVRIQNSKSNVGQ
jgi:hypothetical protein